mmetsp:Transcript_83490/g.183504  ORF Transcript_83490/g.183504 Transcript_83490/m.183504 type:complete len:86 (-) Transcript_83490:1118-1375(-)
MQRIRRCFEDHQPAKHVPIFGACALLQFAVGELPREPSRAEPCRLAPSMHRDDGASLLTSAPSEGSRLPLVFFVTDTPGGMPRNW